MTIKPILLTLALIFLQQFMALSQEVMERIDAEEWIREVERLREDASIEMRNEVLLPLEQYDPLLLRQYFRDFGGESNERDISWKLYGLVVYGQRSDATEVERLGRQLLTLVDKGTEFSRHTELAKYALLAREGTVQEAAQAIAKITSSDLHPEFSMDLLFLSRSVAACDRLANMAADTTLPWQVRLAAMRNLVRLCDERCGEIVFSPGFIEVAKQYTGIIQDEYLLPSLARLSGIFELENVGSLEKAREFIARNRPKPKADFKSKRTVEGGIDWSKYRAKLGLPPLPATPEQAPLPKKIRQPKPEKPDAATTPAQKPPTHNTGTLIAGAVVIMGLLAVLIWFLRKK